MDAKEANLSAKGNLHSLSMSWDGPHRYESDLVKVLEALKPHPNLKSLKIIRFGGYRLPDFGELPCLESLKLEYGSAEVEYVEEDDVHSGFPKRRRFPSLRKLHISGFSNLKGLMKKDEEEQLPMLENMMISDCPMFVFPALSSVKILVVRGHTYATGLRSISNLSTLTSLEIVGIKGTSLPAAMFKSLANLKYLRISRINDLKELPTSLASLNALKRLEIHLCNALESLLKEGLEGLTSLTELSLFDCQMLKSLPKGLKHLTALTSLIVKGCPELEKRCEEDIGEDWHKIAHIPDVDIG